MWTLAADLIGVPTDSWALGVDGGRDKAALRGTVRIRYASAADAGRAAAIVKSGEYPNKTLPTIQKLLHDVRSRADGSTLIVEFARADLDQVDLAQLQAEIGTLAAGM